MKNLKIILTIIGVVVLTSVSIAYFAPQSSNQPVSHVAIQLVLNQTPDYRLSLKTVKVENAYASDYKLAIPFGYYNIKILADEAELFSGRVERNRVSFPPYEIEPANQKTSLQGTTVTPLSEIRLFLPFFIRAKKIVFYDEKNLEKLQVDLSRLTLPKNYTKKLCGNGICDFNENFLRCYRDCRFRL